LDLARGAPRVRNAARRGAWRTIALERARIRVSKIHAIKQVEELGAELDPTAFRDRQILEQGEIRSRMPWAD
jgi:hypothetical protein